MIEVLLAIGVMSSILLFGATFVSMRQAKQISLEERLLRRDSNFQAEKKPDDSFLKKLERDLEQGRTGINLYIYFLIMVVAAVIIFALAKFLVESTPAAVVASFLALLVPREVVKMIADSKRREFDMMFSKALKRMAASLRTSSTLPQAVAEIAMSESLPEVIREEMSRVRTDYEYGIPMEQAFYSMYERTGVEDVKGVALAIEISARKGTKLFETFESYSEAILERKESEAEARAALAGTKMTVNVAAVVPFVFTAFMKWSSPEFFAPMLDLWGGNGRYILLALYLYILIGFVVCRKMTDVKL